MLCTLSSTWVVWTVWNWIALMTQSLRRIPPHPAIIPLYDAFISPKSRELYFVFECMEGNLYQLTKSRRGRPLAAGLIASCFHQITTGLYHIHQHGYFHRDMKPENLLVTTTGLTDYLTASALSAINAQRNGSGGAGGGGLGADDGMAHTMTNGDLTMRYEKDVSVIVKLADFGLARATASRPPYTEYVSTRWYRAPEVLLRSTEYGPPVDMWALGTILAEMLNLKPLFPGASEIDQVYRICETLGDPSPDYGIDERGKVIGGGPWNTGIKLAKNVGFSFPKVGCASVVRCPDAETETNVTSALHRTFVGCSTTKSLSRWSTVSPTCFVTTPNTDSPRRNASTTRTSTRHCLTCSTL